MLPTLVEYKNGFNDDNDNNLLKGYYCTCQSGTRTVGVCAHVISTLQYSGYARHQENIKYPDSAIINATLDAADGQEDIDITDA